MIQLKQVYKCAVCGNIVEVIHVGGGQLVCCGQPMILQIENTVEASLEKHVPVIEKQGNNILVKVGSVAHPMEDKHFIEWIEVNIDGKSCRQYLNPGDKPEATFCGSGENISARAYCNLHGLWQSK
ncbi:MAG: desulfoferrodoxin [bacterium]